MNNNNNSSSSFNQHQQGEHTADESGISSGNAKFTRSLIDDDGYEYKYTAPQKFKATTQVMPFAAPSMVAAKVPSKAEAKMAMPAEEQETSLTEVPSKVLASPTGSLFVSEEHTLLMEGCTAAQTWASLAKAMQGRSDDQRVQVDQAKSQVSGLVYVKHEPVLFRAHAVEAASGKGAHVEVRCEQGDTFAFEQFLSEMNEQVRSLLGLPNEDEDDSAPSWEVDYLLGEECMYTAEVVADMDAEEDVLYDTVAELLQAMQDFPEARLHECASKHAQLVGACLRVCASTKDEHQLRILLVFLRELAQSKEFSNRLLEEFALADHCASLLSHDSVLIEKHALRFLAMVADNSNDGLWYAGDEAKEALKKLQNECKTCVKQSFVSPAMFESVFEKL